jgi:hypothetical protein
MEIRKTRLFSQRVVRIEQSYALRHAMYRGLYAGNEGASLEE